MASDQSSNQLKKVPFSDLDGYVSEKTLKAIEEKGFTEMTEIQSHSIPHLLMGKDLLGAAKTGSGKTLAFLIPVIELILKKRFGAKKGTGAIIISPTRELAIQTYKVLEDLSKYHDYTYGMVIGGTNKMEEIKMLKDGVNILIATPGRLLDHLTNCNGFLYKNLKCLVFDEADKMLEHGFEKDLNEILEILPKERQTVLFSATQTKKTEDLARLSLNEEPIYVGVDDGKEHATVDGLNQGYLKCSMENKFRTLLAFLTNDPAQKVMVFFSSCMEVEFFSQLLSFINFPVMSVHGQQKQSKRTRITDEFREAKKATLLCTDVFGRGVDFEFVDLIIQYDAPDSPKEYIHRVGRTARGHDGTGRAVIFLPPEELEFLNFLKKEKIPIKEWSLLSELPDVQSVMEELVGRVPKLNLTAKEAFKTYIRAYNVRTNKKVFDVHRIDLAEVALSFGLNPVPFVDLGIGFKKKKRPSENIVVEKSKKLKKA